MKNGSYYILDTYYIARTGLGVAKILSRFVSTVSPRVVIATLIYERRELKLGDL